METLKCHLIIFFADFCFETPQPLEIWVGIGLCIFVGTTQSYRFKNSFICIWDNLLLSTIICFLWIICWIIMCQLKFPWIFFNFVVKYTSIIFCESAFYASQSPCSSGLCRSKTRLMTENVLTGQEPSSLAPT